jgi:uncharacterized protein (DUF58 family)
VARDDALQYLDPATLTKVKGLDMVAKLVVEGFITGLHKSPYHGFSVEFAEHRQYMPGDPFKHVDWKLYGKSDRFFVKVYEQETNLRAYLLTDVSASMGYASPGHMTKFRYASYLAASLSYMMLMQQDAVGLLTFRDHIDKLIPARAVPGHLKVLLRELEHAEPSSTTAMAGALHEMAERINRRGLIVLLSDLMDEPDAVMDALKHFRHRQHEVVVFHILDPYEIEFPFTQEAGFVDVETGEELMTHPWEIADDYRRRVEEWSTRYRNLCLENRIEYERLSTATPFDVALLSYLEKRRKLH